MIRWVLRFALRAMIFGALVFALWLTWVVTSAYKQAPKLVAELERVHVLPLSPSELPPGRLCALIAVQDPTFYEHHGVGLRDGHLGHTTITQAIGKGLFFNGFDPGFLRHRKVELMLVAWALDRRVSKDMQLRIFLNRGYFGTVPGGEEIMGFPAAARRYFGKPLPQLSDDQFLALLAMLDGPDGYSVAAFPELNAKRVAVLRPIIAAACGR